MAEKTEKQEKQDRRDSAENGRPAAALEPPPAREPEHQGPIWKHPYMVYVLLTMVLFLGLLAAAYFALENDWIPKR